ncbi:hypothetical protein [Desulfitobacterium hafniense]|uniref:hypothetical protein n=1 Tax=Desulfitobacterium hafniense TaxID=49338 RepID=UPI001AEC49C1|nr:hypothetical protein [Desulfitobacterium hafniense]
MLLNTQRRTPQTNPASELAITVSEAFTGAVKQTWAKLLPRLRDGSHGRDPRPIEQERFRAESRRLQKAV